MRKNAPEGLKEEPAKTAEPPKAQNEPAPPPREKDAASDAGNMDALRRFAKGATRMFDPMGLVAPSVVGALTGEKDSINHLRTIAQGALPFADEGIAGVRSLLGTPYDKALSEERQGLKDYETEHGLLSSMYAQGLGMAGTIPPAVP
jgi:hypothetical protein